MTPLELINASLSYNLGTAGNPQTFKRIKHILVVPLGEQLLPADFANIVSVLQGKMVAAWPNRWQIIKNIAERKDNSTEAKKQDWADGQVKYLYEGQYDWEFYPLTSNRMVQQKLQQLNGREDELGFIFIDDDLSFAGTRGTDTTSGDDSMLPVDLGSILAGKISMDAGEGFKDGLKVTLADAAQLNGGNLMIQRPGITGKDIKNLRPVTDCHLVALDSLASGVVHVVPMISGETNLARIYPTVLGGAGGPALYVSKNASTGATITITSVAAATFNGTPCFTFTFNTSTNYPTTGGKITLTTVTPSALMTAGVKYPIEGDTLTLTV